MDGKRGKSKILIVEDDAATWRQLYWLLCDECEVEVACDLASAFSCVETSAPQIVILDLRLPPQPDSPAVGLRTLEYVKSRSPQTAVLVVSSSDSAETREACRERGADAFLSKPLDVRSLLDGLQSLRL